ncbi:hypothetical protein D3H64_00270 [Atopobacter sp. AH10]|uniref:hypothetical protein n=1 Tax=Atopobacter sp. AH10 TaxID=2315861 RepID=UPI000EF1901E|nr:hypothetical protein [Atopobacter sp. AH10]RLK64248.1 hypothetical protein D3H64_00270 [Atopobacter sp. AH10]
MNDYWGKNLRENSCHLLKRALKEHTVESLLLAYFFYSLKEKREQLKAHWEPLTYKINKLSVNVVDIDPLEYQSIVEELLKNYIVYDYRPSEIECRLLEGMALSLLSQEDDRCFFNIALLLLFEKNSSINWKSYVRNRKKEDDLVALAQGILQIIG